MNAKFLFCLGPLVAIAVYADTIQPTSGLEITGTITKYANSSFDVRDAAGKVRSYSSNSIRRIVFDDRPIPTKVTSRTKGALAGKITAFENGSFTFEGGSGSEKLPAIFIEQINFGGDRGKEIDTITHGAQVDVSQKLVPGSVTIVDFYADWCGPCKQLSPTLEQLAKTDPDVALRKVDIVDWSSPVAKQYNIHSIPHVEIYSRSGKLIGTVRGVSPEQVRQYVAQAKTGG